MTTLTHSIVGVTTAFVIYEVGLSGTLSKIETVAIGVMLANLPDINLLWHKKNPHSHHNDITHYPIFWVFVTTMILLLEFYMFNSVSYSWTLIVGLSVLTHLIMDTFGNTIGVHWLYPLSKKEYSITKLKKELVGSPVKEMFSRKYHGYHIWIEVCVWVVSIIVIISLD